MSEIRNCWTTINTDYESELVQQVGLTVYISALHLILIGLD